MFNHREYHYILVKNSLYVHSELTCLQVFYYLYTRARPFAVFESKTRSRFINLLPTSMIRLMKVLLFTFQFHKKRKTMKSMHEHVPSIRTKVDGHCSLLLRQGEYKVFDLKNKKVITILDQTSSNIEIIKRFRGLKAVAKCILAPRIIELNVEKKIVIEDYLNMRRPSYQLTDIVGIELVIFPITFS